MGLRVKTHVLVFLTVVPEFLSGLEGTCNVISVFGSILLLSLEITVCDYLFISQYTHTIIHTHTHTLIINRKFIFL